MNSVSIPTMEPDRQYYFMNQCKTLVLEKKAALNRPLTYNIQTFGCQIRTSRPRQDIKEQKQRHDRVSVWLHDAGATCH